MPLLPRFRLSDAEKDALPAQQQDMIERLAARVTELEALVGRPRKTSSNSHVPPSMDGFGRGKVIIMPDTEMVHPDRTS